MRSPKFAPSFIASKLKKKKEKKCANEKRIWRIFFLLSGCIESLNHWHRTMHKFVAICRNVYNCTIRLISDPSRYAHYYYDTYYRSPTKKTPKPKSLKWRKKATAVKSSNSRRNNNNIIDEFLVVFADGRWSHLWSIVYGWCSMFYIFFFLLFCSAVKMCGTPNINSFDNNKYFMRTYATATDNETNSSNTLCRCFFFLLFLHSNFVQSNLIVWHEVKPSMFW